MRLGNLCGWDEKELVRVCLGETLPVEGVEVLVLQGLADLHHAVCPEVDQHHSVPVLHPNSSLTIKSKHMQFAWITGIGRRQVPLHHVSASQVDPISGLWHCHCCKWGWILLACNSVHRPPHLIPPSHRIVLSIESKTAACFQGGRRILVQHIREGEGTAISPQRAPQPCRSHPR